MEKITGKNNEIIKSVKKLLTSSKERRASGLFVLEGARLVFDALNSFYEIKYFLIGENAYGKYEGLCCEMIEKSEKAFIISDDITNKLSQTQAPQGVFAVCKMKPEHFELKDGIKCLALDNIQDPGNIGTIIRTGEALGTDGIIIGGGCDIYNPKVLRASMGSVLRTDICCVTHLTDKLSEAKRQGIKIYASTPDKSATAITNADFSGSCICVIGNEANGVCDEVLEVCDERITIPMTGNAESLNAGTAASVIIWEMLR